MDKNVKSLQGPVVIGGVGGSGTRVIARILQELNYFIGNDLNESLDNISYTLLFKRPKWFIKHKAEKNLIEKGLRVLEKSITSKEHFSPAEQIFLLQATIDMFLNGHNICHDGKGKWAINRYRKLLFSARYEVGQFTGWGWKEPNSHLLLEYMNDFFPGLKYIHIIRHGLDMAFSQNQQQLYNWGSLYGILTPVELEKVPEASFRYWVAVHENILKKAAQLDHKKFLMINFDNLCREPGKEIKKLLTFLEIAHDYVDIEALAAVPRIPASQGRYNRMPIPWLTPEDIKLLEKLGFI